MPGFAATHRCVACLLTSLVGCGSDPGATSGTASGSVTTGEAVTTTTAPDPSTTDLTPTSSVAGTTGSSTTDVASTGPADTSSAGTTEATTSEASTTTSSETSGSTTGALDPACGDGAVDPGEACDDGPNNGPGQPCNTMCAPNICGDGDKGPDEACDDGNDVDTDACTTACVLAACGDGLVGPREQCDDGNIADGDGCSAVCATEAAKPLGKIYLTSANSEPGFHGYTIASDTWTTLASPPEVTCSQLTNDGESVYLLGIDNVVYQYDIDADSWSPAAIAGPGEDLVLEPIGHFKWTDQGFFYLHDYEKTLRRYKDGAWQAIALPTRGACAGSWDRLKDELYIRTWAEMGFQVIDTATGTVVRTIFDATTITESSRVGSPAPVCGHHSTNS